MKEALFSLGNWIALVVSFGLVGVWIAYGLLFRWRATRAGTAFFVFLSALTASITLSASTLWLGTDWGVVAGLPVRELVRIGVYLYSAYALIYLVGALIYNYRRTGVVLDLERRASHARGLIGEPMEETTP